MEVKDVFLRKGHVIKNVPCDKERNLDKHVKDTIRTHYFSKMLNSDKMVTVDYLTITQEK